MDKQVTELDLRRPEFQDPKLKPEHFEFDSTGEVVRKDRFERGMRKIASILHGVNGLSPSGSWNVEQVVEAVQIVIERGANDINLTR